MIRAGLPDGWRPAASGWWRARARRERLLLAILGGVALVVQIAMLVVRPLRAARAAALADIRTYATVGARLRAAGPAPAATPRAGDLAAIVRASAARFAVPVRAATSEGGGVRVRAPGVAYEALVRWLADLDRTDGVRAAQLSLVKAAAPGDVDATLVLVR